MAEPTVTLELTIGELETLSRAVSSKFTGMRVLQKNQRPPRDATESALRQAFVQDITNLEAIQERLSELRRTRV